MEKNFCDMCGKSPAFKERRPILGFMICADICKKCEYKNFRIPMEKIQKKVKDFYTKIVKEELRPFLKKLNQEDICTEHVKGCNRFLNSL